MSLANLIINFIAKTDNLEAGTRRANQSLQGLAKSAKVFDSSLGQGIATFGKIGTAAAAYYAISKSVAEVASNSEKFRGIMSDEQIAAATVLNSTITNVKTEFTAMFAMAGAWVTELVNAEAVLRKMQPQMNWSGIEKNREKQDAVAETLRRKLDPIYAAQKEYEETVAVFKSQLDRNKIGTGEFEQRKAEAYSRYQSQLPSTKENEQRQRDQQANDMQEAIRKETERSNIYQSIAMEQRMIENAMKRSLGVSERQIQFDNFREDMEKRMVGYSEEQRAMWEERLDLMFKAVTELEKMEEMEKDAKDKSSGSGGGSMDKIDVYHDSGQFQQFDPSNVSVSGLAMRGATDQSLMQIAKNTERTAVNTGKNTGATV